MKEAHHRIKNNLVTISTLLSLQAKYINDQNAKEALMDSQNRAKAMAIIHQKIYSYADFEKIDLNNYFTQLIEEVLKTYSADKKINYYLDVKNISLNVDTSLILGLIIIELLSNSLKYAFNGQNGIINVTLSKIKNKYILKVSDNGKSMQKDLDLENTGSFGLTIVNLLVTQLNGQITVNKSGGTIFTISFKQ